MMVLSVLYCGVVRCGSGSSSSSSGVICDSVVLVILEYVAMMHGNEWFGGDRGGVLQW